MTTTTKAVAWVGAIFGTVSVRGSGFDHGAHDVHGVQKQRTAASTAGGCGTIEAGLSAGSPKPVKDGD